MEIAAVLREEIFSPQMKQKDYAILKSIADKLVSLGHDVTVYRAEDLPTDKHFDLIYHMSRSTNAIAKLSEIEKNDTKVINSTQSVSNCSRDKFISILNEAEIRQPRYNIIPTSSNAPTNGYPLWFKKSAGWSSHKQDICYIADRKSAEATLELYRKRGIDSIHSCNHIDGNIIKFYGVSDIFFRCYYPNPDSTKFSLEKFNRCDSHYIFSIEELQETAFRAAKAIGLEIYGGDAIITKEGTIYIIDINDFPSFSAYREEASEAIAYLINSKIKKR
ncbi:MAG: hypothetical protein IKD40_05140 [Bacteroidaceae bacterium]|nr:hypothetical protein [Bacteroidaceae bacterium]